MHSYYQKHAQKIVKYEIQRIVELYNIANLKNKTINYFSINICMNKSWFSVNSVK